MPGSRDSARHPGHPVEAGGQDPPGDDPPGQPHGFGIGPDRVADPRSAGLEGADHGLGHLLRVATVGRHALVDETLEGLDQRQVGAVVGLVAGRALPDLGALVPALWTTASRALPVAARTSFTARSIDAWSVTSSCTTSAVTFARARASSRRPRLSRLRMLANTRQPRWARSTAVSRPNPLEQPVTRTEPLTCPTPRGSPGCALRRPPGGRGNWSG
jgi:hypothetical protein